MYALDQRNHLGEGEQGLFWILVHFWTDDAEPHVYDARVAPRPKPQRTTTAATLLREDSAF